MKRVLLTFIFFIVPASALLFSIDMQSSGTGCIGGVTLFDADSPFVGINNPALLIGYGSIKKDPKLLMNSYEPDRNDINGVEDTLPNPIDVAYDPKAFENKYYFGRIYFANIYFGVGFSEDLLRTFPNFIQMNQGFFSNVDVNSTTTFPFLKVSSLLDFIKFCSFGYIDPYPLFSQSQADYKQAMNNVANLPNNNKIGMNSLVNVNWLSYYRNDIGVSLYSSFDGYFGLFGNDNSFLFFSNDPALYFNFQTGLAFSLGWGEIYLPFLEKFNIGYTIRTYYLLTGQASNFSNYIELNNEMSKFNQNNNIFDLSAFSKGGLVKGGVGASLDVGITKELFDNFYFAGKISDAVAPIYWLQSNSFGWILPDLSTGIKYVIQIPGDLNFIINQPSLYLQVNDLFYTYPEAFLSKIHMGIDSKFLFDIVQIGTGISQGYPTAGISLHFTFAWLENIPGFRNISYILAPITYAHLKLSLSIYGKEYGQYPGDLGFQSYNVGAELFWGF